jgi:hypothetical protein
VGTLDDVGSVVVELDDFGCGRGDCFGVEGRVDGDVSFEVVVADFQLDCFVEIAL